jgi:hypothetical protein
MPDILYVGLQEDDKIVVFALDGDQGSRMRNQRLSMMQGLAAAKPHRR